MTVVKLTPQQAADRANVSRGTIMNAIKERSLVAFRDNRNRWQIDDNELSKWLSARTGIDTGNSVNPDSQTPVPIDENIIRIAVLEAELRGKDQRIADLERDRDDWKAQAQELARRDIPSGPPDPLPAAVAGGPSRPLCSTCGCLLHHNRFYDTGSVGAGNQPGVVGWRLLRTLFTSSSTTWRNSFYWRTTPP